MRGTDENSAVLKMFFGIFTRACARNTNLENVIRLFRLPEKEAGRRRSEFPEISEALKKRSLK